MHILIIAPEQIPVPPPIGGSVENCIYQISRRISTAHRVTIVSREHKRYPVKSVRGNVTIHRVGGGSVKAYLANALQKVKGESYDIIQIDNRPRYVPAVREAFPHTPISVFLHSLTFVSPPMSSTKQAEDDLAKADLIVGNSRSLQAQLGRLFPAQQNKVKYVHLGVDLKQFRPRLAAAKRRAGGFTILFAGRLIPRKGIPILMKATKLVRKSVPSARLMIAGGTGDADYRRYLRRLAASLRIPVAFKGYVPRSAMHRFYWSGDVFVCPSQRHEAFGLVNVEAMAAGTPCIASRIGGIPEIIEHRRNGLLVDNYTSPAAFAKQILMLAQNPAMARRLERQARRDAVQTFSWKATASRLESIYAAHVGTVKPKRMTGDVQ